MTNFKFDSPFYFIFLLIIPILYFLRVFFKKNQFNGIEIPNYNWVIKNNFFSFLPILYFLNKIIIIILIIIGICRPQLICISEDSIDKFGVDIILTIDVSNSMLARDLKPNRLSVLKKNAKEFIQNRILDRIGIVVFSGEAFTKTPLTSDKKILSSTIDSLNLGFLEDGTAIGIGIGTAINHLKYSKAKSKIIVLMTDGENTSGIIDPILSANIAKSYGIKIYTIGIGTKGEAEIPIAINSITGEFEYEVMPVTIGEDLLIDISKITGGKYFRAKNNKEFQKIYKTIDNLEKSKINYETMYNYKELYRIPLVIATFLLLIELMFKLCIFKTIN